MNSQLLRTSSDLYLIPVSDGGFFLAARDGVYQYNANGQIIGKSSEAVKDGKRLLATRRGRAIVADAKSLFEIKMTPVKTVAKK